MLSWGIEQLSSNSGLVGIMSKLLIATALIGAAYAQNTSLPEVNLGYEIHQASSFNVSTLRLYMHITTNS
jgi:hypothetical protein